MIPNSAVIQKSLRTPGFGTNSPALACQIEARGFNDCVQEVLAQGSLSLLASMQTVYASGIYLRTKVFTCLALRATPFDTDWALLRRPR